MDTHDHIKPDGSIDHTVLCRKLRTLLASTQQMTLDGQDIEVWPVWETMCHAASLIDAMPRAYVPDVSYGPSSCFRFCSDLQSWFIADESAGLSCQIKRENDDVLILLRFNEVGQPLSLKFPASFADMLGETMVRLARKKD